MITRPHRATIGCVLLLAVLPLLGCGDGPGRARPPEEMVEDKQQPQAPVQETTARAQGEPEVRTPQATAECVKGIAGVRAARALKDPFGEGDKEVGLEAAVITDVATVLFYESSTKAKQSAKLLRRGDGGVYRVVGRAVIQYASEPETRLDADLQRCLTDPATP